jgi:hypothetical protein
MQGPLREPNQLQCHRIDLGACGLSTLIRGWPPRPHALGACSQSEPNGCAPGDSDETQGWTEESGPRHRRGPARASSRWLGNRTKASDVDQSGMDRVDGCGYGKPNRTGTGRSKCGVMGELFLATPHSSVGDTAPMRDYPLLGKQLECGE